MLTTATLPGCHTRRYTSVAFDGWKQVTLQTKALLQRTFGHWMNSTLSGVWRRWREMVREAQEARESGRRAVARWRLRFVTMTFEVRNDHSEPNLPQIA